MSVVNKFRGFRDKEEGNATIEFVLLFPTFIFLFLTGFEAGYYMVRNVALERATDIAIRDVRLSNGNVPGWAALKKRICDEAGIIPDCMRTLQVEMRPIPKGQGGVASVVGNGRVRCIDTGAPAGTDQTGSYTAGIENQMMLVTVCSLSQPLFPTTGIGVGMKIDTEGNYALVATTAFVNEPGNRAMGQGNGNSSNTNGNSGNSVGNGASTSSGNQGNGNGNTGTGNSGTGNGGNG